MIANAADSESLDQMIFCSLRKISSLANHFAISNDAISSLDEGRFLETILKTERGVAFRGGGS